MADYDCCNPRSTGSSLETVVSTSQAVPSSCESIWEGWTQTSPAMHCALTEQLQQLGGCSTSTRNVSPYQHDLLSSWLMSGFQNSGLHQQHEEEGSAITMYQDEYSRINICSSTSDHGGPAGGPDASHQLFLQSSNSSVQTNNSTGGPTDIEQSEQFLSNSPPSGRVDNQQAHDDSTKLDDANQQMIEQMRTTELSSRGSSSSPPAGLSSYGMMQHLVGQFENSPYWASSVTPVASQTSNFGGGMRPMGQQRDHPNTSCESVILHHQLQSKRGSQGDVVFSNPDLTDQMHMYPELHGLLTKSLEGPAHDAVDQQLAIGGSNPRPNGAGTYGDQSGWTQFSADPMPNASAGPSHGGFIGIQEVDQTMFDSNASTPDALSTAAKRDDLSPSSAGTAMSTIASGHSHALTYGSACADLDSSESLQRKRLSRVSEQVGESGVSAEESVKRSCIVRRVWEQNIAQLQLANLPSENHRNLWQFQSQALFGRVPGNFLLGTSSNSNSMDMHTAVGPALNTNGRPRARRGSATDPQSVYARHRRERINDRLKVLQHLIPNGAKVDIVTMLEEAINYVKFLQVQVRLLSSDELWIYAPTTYNGVDVSMGMHAGLLNQQV